MFSDFNLETLERMKFLEEVDNRDRKDGTPRSQRLRQITKDTGKFLALLVVNCPQGEIIEIGTSAAYSTLWLGMAAKEMNRKIKTFELSEEKITLAKETIKIAELENHVEIISGDFLEYAPQLSPIAFCFLDAEKEIYKFCFDAICNNMVYNGLIIADNATDMYTGIKPMIDAATHDKRFDCLTLPIGNGEFMCRRNKK